MGAAISAAEVLVIGGGPAGLAAAIAAAQAGYSAAVAEPCIGPINKCCGEGLLPSAVIALKALGIPPLALKEQGAVFEGICFQTPGARASASFHGPAQAIGVRRTVLHTLLRSRATEAGVVFLPSSARLLAPAPGEQDFRVLVSDTELRPRWILGADGARSSVRRGAGLEQGRVHSARVACRQHFRLSPAVAAPTHVVVQWAAGMQAYVTPVGDGCIGIAIVAAQKFASMDRALQHFPALGDLLVGASAIDAARGAATCHRTLRRVYRSNVALVGDASGGVDAITGDGLSLAFQQALTLGSALRDSDLPTYQRAHDRLLRPAKRMSHALLAMGAGSLQTKVCVRLLAGIPGLFPFLLNQHAQLRTEAEEDAPWQNAHTSTRSKTLRPAARAAKSA